MKFDKNSLPEHLKDAQVVGVSNLSTWAFCKEDREAAKGKILIVCRLSDKGIELKEKMKTE